MNVITLTPSATDARARGEQIGAATAAAVREAVDRYRGAYTEVGIAEATVADVAAGCGDALAEWDPEQLAELTGVAAGSGLELADVMVLTARTEILSYAAPTVGECSTIVVLHAGRRPMTMQTWDWHAELAPTGLFLESELASGRRVRTFTEPGMLAKIGLNDAGLGLHFNILHHVSDRAIGVPVHAITRRILAEATTVDEAIDLARSAPIGASTVLTVVTADDAASIELAPAGVGVVRPVDGVLVHTNHFVDPALVDGEATPDASTTYVRYDHLGASRAAATAATDAVELAAAMCGAAGEAAPVCIRPVQDLPMAQRWQTLLTASLDVESHAIDWFAGPPSGLVPSTVNRFPTPDGPLH